MKRALQPENGDFETLNEISARLEVLSGTLPERTSNLVDCNFIIRMLYLNAY